jgi:hypothetical protein
MQNREELRQIGNNKVEKRVPRRGKNIIFGKRGEGT